MRSPQGPQVQAGARQHWMVGLNAALLVALWLFESRLGEAFWLSGALCYLPQHLIPLPTLALLVLALRRRDWKAGAAFFLSLGWAVHVFVGLQIPLASLASTWRPSSGGPPRPALRLMTYNIVGGTRGLANVASTIRAQKPDVLCLQEAVVIEEGQADPIGPLHRLLPGYHEARAGEVCIFSRFPILAQRQKQFPRGAARFVLEAVLDVRGVPVRVITVHPTTIAFRDGARHFPARIAHSLSLRHDQVETLLSVIERPASTWKREWREAPLLVAGDFNTPPRGRIYNTMAARLGDSWREAGWWLGDTFSAEWPLVRIDYVWHSPEWTARRAFVPRSHASDHRPLVVDLGL